jgi:putative adenylate-forming enzyme
MDKNQFMLHFDDINTCGIHQEEAINLVLQAEKSRDFSPTLRYITLGLSSGTSGNKSVFMASTRERALWAATILDRVIGFPLKRQKVAFFLRANSNLYTSVGSALIQFQFFDLLAPLANNLKRLDFLQPTILVAQPSMLLEIAKAIEQKAIHLSPAKVISVAEVLSTEDRLYLEKTFKQIIHQVYQCTEGLLASTCLHGTLHFHEDYLVIEKKYVDHDRIRFHPIITDLFRFAQPVIRYELNDLIMEKKHCPCGSRLMGIEQIEGRSDDVFEFMDQQGALHKIFPDFLRRAVILSSPAVEDYVLIQKTGTLLTLYISPSNLFESAVWSLKQFLKEQGIRDIQILYAPEKGHQPGDKLRRIKNESRKTS